MDSDECLGKEKSKNGNVPPATLRKAWDCQVAGRDRELRVRQE
jgi:hypothetical protein